MDKAAIKDSENVCGITKINKWYLSTLTDVEEVKLVQRMLPTSTVVFWTVQVQMLTLSVSHETTMNCLIGKSFQIPAASMTSFLSFLPSIIAEFSMFLARWVLPYITEKIIEIYRMGRKLGQGQFGTTYLCTHKSSNRRYACKSTPKWKLFCKEDYEDVWREIQIMHHLSEHS